MTSEININEEEGKKSLNFIEAAVEKDLAAGKNGGRVQTRFPPEPNGYYTSVMQKQFVLTSVSQRDTEAFVTCVSTIPTRRKRMRNM